MVSLEDFNLEPVVVKMMNDNSVVEVNDIITHLELYKFVSRTEIINVLKSKYGTTMEDVPLVSRRTVDSYTEEIYKTIEDRYDVIVEVIDSMHSRVILSFSNPVNIETLSLSITSGRVDIIYVTPVNYMELKGVRMFSWNYDILFKRILMEANKYKATDLHITVKHSPDFKTYYPVEFRVDTDMITCDLFNLDEEMNKSLIHKLIHRRSSANSDDLETIHGVVTSVTDILGDGDTQLRVTANKVFRGYHCVCRIQRLSTVSLTISELGFREDIQEDLLDTSKKVGGLTLMTGGPGTGKNTTAFAIGNEMLKRPIKMIDYSSPIEVLMPFPQVDYKADYDYLIQCVRLSKKQDINVAFINEVPNKEVAGAIYDLVNSNIHVVTTTHLSRLWHLPQKLYEYFGQDYKNVLTQLNICVNQRMFSKQCPHCRNMALVSGLPDKYRKLLSSYGVDKYYVNKGCPLCKQGKLIGKLQPYVERIVFTSDVVSQLLKYNAPYEMEMFIKEYITSKEHNLEALLCEAVSNGDLGIYSLDSIL